MARPESAEPAKPAASKAPEPPKTLLEVVSLLMKAVVCSPLYGTVTRSIILLTFKGRKAGRL
jgi:hypothetical protein